MPDPTINYNHLAEDYARHRRVNPEVLKHLIEAGEVNSQSHVLEVGCGSGNYSRALVDLTGCTAVGVDPSEAMLAQAKAQSEAIQFQLGRAEQLDFPDGHFDFVFSVDVIHHVKDQAAYYQQAARVLEPGGNLCTATDSAEVIGRRRPLSNFFPQTVEVELKRYPRIATLRRVMAAAGFRQISEAVVEFAYPLTDMAAYRDRAFSSLHLISDEAFEQGIARMEAALQTGSIEGLSLYTMLSGTRHQQPSTTMRR